jgi:hypothetical protein
MGCQSHVSEAYHKAVRPRIACDSDGDQSQQWTVARLYGERFEVLLGLVSWAAASMFTFAVIITFLTLAGCFYPPQQKPLSISRTHRVVQAPYYRAWDALHRVVERNEYRVITEEPDKGTLEAQATGGFTLADADCGKLKGIAGKYAAQPDVDSSAIYDFEIKPRGNEASTIVVTATFTAPLHVPLRPPRGEECVSRGIEEARLLRQIAQEAQAPDASESPASPAPLPARETVR